MKLPEGWIKADEIAGALGPKQSLPSDHENHIIGPVAWLIKFSYNGMNFHNVALYNSIADYQDFHPDAESVPLYINAQSDGIRMAAASVVEYYFNPEISGIGLDRRMEALRDSLEKTK